MATNLETLEENDEEYEYYYDDEQDSKKNDYEYEYYEDEDYDEEDFEYYEYYNDDDNQKTEEQTENAIIDEKKALRGRKRQHSISELLSTEITYVNLLTKLVVHYVIALKEKRILSKNEYKIIFPSDIHTILQLNQTFLFDLRNVIEQNFNKQTSKIGHIILSFCPHFKMYQQYCNNYTTAATKLAQLRKKSKSKFSKYCDKQMEAEYFNNLCLEQLIILPIQRMPRYKLLLSEIVKHTGLKSTILSQKKLSIFDHVFKQSELNHPDLIDLKLALDEISKVNESINDKIKVFESRIEVQNIENRFKGKIKNLVTPSRIYIKQGQLCKLEQKEQVYYLFILFNDCILYASQSMIGNKLIIGKRIPFNSKFCCQKSSGAMKIISGISNLFQIYSSEESFMLFAETQKSMNKWVKIINVTFDNWMQSGTVKPDDSKIYVATLPIPDNFSDKCMVKGCGNGFNLLHRRHHCYFCGFLVCAQCRKNKIKHKAKGLVKVCSVCHQNYINHQRKSTRFIQDAAMETLKNELNENKEVSMVITRSRQQTTFKQSGKEKILVMGYLRRCLSLISCMDLPQNVLYLCNLSFGSIKKQRRARGGSKLKTRARSTVFHTNAQ